MDDLYIKAATVIAVALASFSSFPSPAQQQQEQPARPAQTAPAANQQSAQNAAAAQLTPVRAELLSKLDSKSAKEGDSVMVKTKEDLKFPGGTDLPKGSKLIGHVTNVQARTEGKENSQIAIQFDHAESKDGKNMAIESVIKSVSPAADESSAMDNSVPGSYGANAGSTNPGSTTPGMRGSGSPNSDRPGLASNTTAEPGTTNQTMNGNQTTNGGVPAPGSIVARNGNVAIRTTAIPGVLLANDVNGLPFTNASGMLLGARRDIHLDGGTQMVVAIAAAPEGAGGMSR